ncbi:ABC transporter permease [Streptomyces sp. NPDC046821]|uniref:ABC transporter permease n=1 Tax=Streptomyces sp. NPDC046821 TaxID=3154702 RepID=UPI0033C7E8C2
MTTPPPQPAPQAYAPQSAPNWQGAPGTSYTSPIPVTPTHLGHALSSEWTKIRSVRSTMWTLGIFVFLVIAFGLLVSSQTEDMNYRELPFTFPAFIGLILGQICLITLGVLVTSSEYGTGMIRTTFTASPQRYRVLAAKILVFFAVSFVVSAVCIFLVGLLTSLMHGGPQPGGPTWGGTVLKGALYVSLLGVLGLAVGSMLRHSAGAITAMLGIVLLPSILPVFLMISRSTRAIGEKMQDYNAINSLAKIFGADGGSSGGSQVWLLVGVTAAAVIGAFALLEKRDV